MASSSSFFNHSGGICMFLIWRGLLRRMQPTQGLLHVRSARCIKTGVVFMLITVLNNISAVNKWGGRETG